MGIIQIWLALRWHGHGSASTRNPAAQRTVADPSGRLRLLDKDVEVYRQVIRQIIARRPVGRAAVVTDPPNRLAFLTRELAGHGAFLSTGTLLDNLHFRVHLGRKLKVAPTDIEAQVLGAHGTSQVLSLVRLPAWGASRARMRLGNAAFSTTTTSRARSRREYVMQI